MKAVVSEFKIPVNQHDGRSADVATDYPSQLGEVLEARGFETELIGFTDDYNKKDYLRTVRDKAAETSEDEPFFLYVHGHSTPPGYEKEGFTLSKPVYGDEADPACELAAQVVTPEELFDAVREGRPSGPTFVGIDTCFGGRYASYFAEHPMEDTAVVASGTPEEMTARSREEEHDSLVVADSLVKVLEEEEEVDLARLNDHVGRTGLAEQWERLMQLAEVKLKDLAGVEQVSRGKAYIESYGSCTV